LEHDDRLAEDVSGSERGVECRVVIASEGVSEPDEDERRVLRRSVGNLAGAQHEDVSCAAHAAPTSSGPSLRTLFTARATGITAQLAGEGSQQVLYIIRVGNTGVEPAVIVLGGEDDRHPVVQGRHQFVGRGGKDRAAQQLVTPHVVESGETDRLTP